MSKLKYYDGTNWKIVNGQITGDTLPIGAIVPFGGWDAPTGWLICDGTLLNKTTYPELFNAIGYSFGGEEGGSTFGLPDLRGRVPVGEKDNDSDFDGMGVTGGSKELQAHNHEGLRWGSSSGTRMIYTSNSGSSAGFDLANPGVKTVQFDASTTQKIVTENAGTGNSGNLQPYQTVNYIIKAKQSAGLVANVSNTYSASQTDTYSCDYVNGIIESGSNTNGSYIKYADGTLICRGSAGPITTNAGTGADATITLPYNFKDRWFDVTISIIDGQAYWGQIQFSLITLSGSQFKITTWNNSGGTNANQYFSYIAIGRWK